ncbi:MAG: DivIVA domain-containing protein [Acidimicrobiales bacterium]|nr:DivIVA domain-containing protein [Acidimicrobiales bacterium]RZV41658.1 MAG: DivIVA domain-containing protein [Acidimicrobiales bacterium]
MDLIRELKDVRFELALRGYDCDAVDAFLAKVRAEVAELQSQRENAQSRVGALEEQVASGESDTEGTLRRTLILAQRLADETVADARNSATEMIDSATAESAEIRSSTQAEIEASLAEAEQRTANMRAEADAEREASASAATDAVAAAESEAAHTRAIATEHAEQLLVDAERAGSERVVALETTAKDEAARMREPIRAEVEQLEQTRSLLQSDIGALEEHLATQRERVKQAVEALRIGMSGSIHDLERLADDDEVLAVEDRPELSNAGASDVAVAPDVDIVEAVNDTATPAPTVEQMSAVIDSDIAERESAAEPDEPAEASAEDAASPLEAEDPEIEDGEPVEPDDDTITDASGDITEVVIEGQEVHDEGEPTQALPVVEIEGALTEAADEVEDAPGDLVENATGDTGMAVAGHDVVDLDAEPSALFETDVSESTEVIEAEATEVIEAPASSEGSFTDRLGEALGSMPVQGNS